MDRAAHVERAGGLSRQDREDGGGGASRTIVCAVVRHMPVIVRVRTGEDGSGRLCPCGVPKEAMAGRGPDGRLVPSSKLENRYSLEQRPTSRSLTELRG